MPPPCSQVALASTAVEAPPHGGKLIDLMITDDAAKKAAADSCKKTLELTPRQLCDVELIANGGFSPLTGFMTEAEYNSVCLLYTSPSPRDQRGSRMPSSA